MQIYLTNIWTSSDQNFVLTDLGPANNYGSKIKLIKNPIKFKIILIWNRSLYT